MLKYAQICKIVVEKLCSNGYIIGVRHECGVRIFDIYYCSLWGGLFGSK